MSKTPRPKQRRKKALQDLLLRKVGRSNEWETLDKKVSVETNNLDKKVEEKIVPRPCPSCVVSEDSKINF